MRTATRTAVLASTLVGALGACASGYGGGPPGGREDRTAPTIVQITPDTNAVRATPRAMVVQFDGVISERPAGQGATSLADLVVISPRDGQPRVEWHRDNLTIRPRKGWRPNTTYTVTILPGIADLRGNVARTQTQVTFSTGASIAQTMVRGTAFDWLTGKPLRDATVEAISRKDTLLVYVGTADSLGHFSLRGLNEGAYLLRAYEDQRKNNALDPNEPFDSSAVSVSPTAPATWTELLAFVHDSSGPTLSSVAVEDSVTLRARFATPLDPVRTLEMAAFTLLASDSSRVAITAVKPAREDSVTMIPAARGGQPARGIVPPPPARVDSTTPRPSKPLLFREVFVSVATPLRVKSTYTLRATGVRGPTGLTATSQRNVLIPAPRDTTTTKATKPPTTKAPPPIR